MFLSDIHTKEGILDFAKHKCMFIYDQHHLASRYEMLLKIIKIITYNMVVLVHFNDKIRVLKLFSCLIYLIRLTYRCQNVQHINDPSSRECYLA